MDAHNVHIYYSRRSSYISLGYKSNIWPWSLETLSSQLRSDTTIRFFSYLNQKIGVYCAVSLEIIWQWCCYCGWNTHKRKQWNIQLAHVTIARSPLHYITACKVTKSIVILPMPFGTIWSYFGVFPAHKFAVSTVFLQIVHRLLMSSMRYIFCMYSHHLVWESWKATFLSSSSVWMFIFTWKSHLYSYRYQMNTPTFR